MTAWRLCDASGTPRPGLYATEDEAAADAEPTDEAEEVDVTRHELMILAPWLLDYADA